MTVNFDVPAKKESGLLFSREAASAHDLKALDLTRRQTAKRQVFFRLLLVDWLE